MNILALVVAVLAAPNPTAVQRAKMLLPLAKIVSFAHKIPVDVTMAIMEQESNYRPLIVSPTRDCGVMGVHVGRNAWRKCLALRFAPYGTWRGVSALARWRKRTPNMRTALACYNGGNSCDSFGYADEVLARAARIRSRL